MRLVLFVLLLCSGACKPAAKAVPDAGTPVERGTDLRIAMTTIFPEYRGASLAAGRAQVTRVVAPVNEAALEQARAAAAKSGFEGEPLMRPPFAMELELDGGVLRQEVRLALPPEELGRILGAPAAMSTEALAHWLPKVGPRQHEEFELELIWVASSLSRADFLLWQVVDGALSTGWRADALPSGWQRERVDGGAVQVPPEFSFSLSHPALGATIELERKQERARLRYRLITYERR